MTEQIAQEIAVCPERVWRGSDYTGGYERCGKPEKRDGLCGVHARSKDRRAEATAAVAQRSSARQAQAAARTRVLAFLDAWGEYDAEDCIAVKGYGTLRLSAADLRVALGAERE